MWAHWDTHKHFSMWTLSRRACFLPDVSIKIKGLKLLQVIFVTVFGQWPMSPLALLTQHERKDIFWYPNTVCECFHFSVTVACNAQSHGNALHVNVSSLTLSASTLKLMCCDLKLITVKAELLKMSVVGFLILSEPILTYFLKVLRQKHYVHFMVRWTIILII